MLSILNPKKNLKALQELIHLLRRYKVLTLELAKREIQEKYTGQLLGLLWTIGHPLLLVLIYVFIFGFVFQTRVGNSLSMPLDYTTYLLAGIIPWLAFQESMLKSSTVIIANANIVKQVVFPVEVLPVKGVLATLATQLVFFALLSLYTVITNGALLWTYMLLPLLILIQLSVMTGLGYLLAAIGVFFRDIKEFVQVFSSLALFLLPILYLPEVVPASVRPILYLNPLSYMIWCYQDILYFGRIEHPWAWVIFPLLGLSMLLIGYRTFRRFKLLFGNVL